MEEDEEDGYFCSRGGLERQRRNGQRSSLVFEDGVADVGGVRSM